MVEMTGEEIKKLVDKKNQELKDAFTPNFFIVNKKMQEITKEITELQSQCPHEFKDGLCIYCYKKEDNN